jgi:hypothetical protein
MNGEDLRKQLHDLQLNHSELARLVGITPRAVNLWIADERAVPGPVESYLRLLQLLPSQLRLIELARLKQKGTNMSDGMFGIVYSGNAGFGSGTLIFDNGRVYGADTERGRYDGMYLFNEASGLAEVTLKVTMPANTMSVFGISNPYEWAIDVTAAIDPKLDSGHVAVKSSLGPSLQAQYKFLRGLPDAI